MFQTTKIFLQQFEYTRLWRRAPIHSRPAKIKIFKIEICTCVYAYMCKYRLYHNFKYDDSRSLFRRYQDCTSNWTKIKISLQHTFFKTNM